jgi:flagellar L-ring protein precursor FlgH
MKMLFAVIPVALWAQSPGSLYQSGGILANASRDVKAGAPGDIVTIVVSDRASAAATGGTNTKRQSSGGNEITSLIGTLAAGNPLGNLLDFQNQRAIQSDGETTREMNLTTTLSARVVAVTLNGLLVIEGTKESIVNLERQTVTLRGMIRAVDITPANTILSNQISDLTVQVNGKGVVNDAIKRPFILFRLLTEFLPF